MCQTKIFHEKRKVKFQKKGEIEKFIQNFFIS